jgi:hypothetical protein
MTKFDGLDVFELLQEDSAPLPGEGVEPELTSSGKIRPEEPQCAKGQQPRKWGATFELNHLFFVQEWHKPYAEALLEDDFTKLPELITAAERAILTRYLELNASKIPTDERLDLRHAVDALVQLKTRIPPPRPFRKFFAPTLTTKFHSAGARSLLGSAEALAGRPHAQKSLYCSAGSE